MRQYRRALLGAVVLAWAQNAQAQISQPRIPIAPPTYQPPRVRDYAGPPVEIPPDAPKPFTPGFIAWWTAHGPKRAPPGYHYEGGSYVISPNDKCWDEALMTPAALGHLNSSVGKKDGMPGTVGALTDLATPETLTLASIDVQLPHWGQQSLSCHATLKLADGTAQSGIFTIIDPGKYAELQISWIADVAIAAQRARADRLATSKTLLVKPDLTTPEIQICVGRSTALGAHEDFAGQLWAACADYLKNPPPPRPKIGP